MKNNVIWNPEVILQDIFEIRDMPDIKPVSIKIESRNWRDAFYGHRSSGIFLKDIPKETFDKLVTYNKEHHLGYKIYVG